MSQKIDSNATGLSFAEEASLGVLGGTPIWRQLEPNSYKDFGGQVKITAREPINPSRQKRKGTVTGIDAAGGFQQDLTIPNTSRLLQGVMFAAVREKPTTQPMNGAAVVLTSVSATQVLAAAGLGSFLSNHLIFGSGFGVPGNNGLHKVTVVAAGAVTASNFTIEAAPPAAAKIEAVGYEFDVATTDITIVGGLPRLTRMSGVVDFTTLGLIPGEWVYLGADAAGNVFANNAGLARVNAVAATYIEFDKTDWTPQAEVGTAKSIRIYFGSNTKNESDPTLIKRFTYQLERTLDRDANGVMSEYLPGSVASEMTIDMKQEDKVTIDFSFLALDHEPRTGTQGVKAGTRLPVYSADAFNTSSDFSRINLSKVDPTNAKPVPLFAFAMDMNIAIKNNVSANKALGRLGAFDLTAGMFDVSGKITAYFSDNEAVQAIRQNGDVTIDVALVKNNAGIVIDIPLVSLGDGRLQVEKDKAIQLPLEISATESKFHHTALFTVFPYLPTIAG